MRNIKDKLMAKMFIKVIDNLILCTSREKAVDVMQKDIIRRIHNFILEAPV